MGFIYIKTCDTEDLVPTRFDKGCRPVYLLQPGNLPSIEETRYEGYGVFGGMDMFVWLAEHNLPGNELARLDFEGKREKGIELYYEEDVKVMFPLKFSFNEHACYEDCPASSQDIVTADFEKLK